MRTKVTMLGLLAAPLFMAQCAPACAPAPPPPTRPAVAVFGCVDGPDVHWWLNAAGVLPDTRGPLLGDVVTASVDGMRFSDPVTIGPHPETGLAHFHGAIEATGGVDVDLTVAGPDGVVDARADDLGACPLASVELSGATLDCAGTLSVRMAVTVQGGQFDPPPRAKVDVWAQAEDPPTGPAPPVVRLVDAGAGALTSGTIRELAGSGLAAGATWNVWAIATPVSVNGIDGAAGSVSDWPVQTMTGTPVAPRC